jgi:ABC-type nitrate/sulfonate/bicarbonate transport system substrate-binding protein
MDAAVLSVEQRYVGLDKGMREMFFFGNEVKNSWGTLATTDRVIKENPKMARAFVRATLKASALHAPGQGRNGQRADEILRRLAPAGDARLYDDLIGTFTRNGAVDDEAQRNDLDIIRQVVNAAEAVQDGQSVRLQFRPGSRSTAEQDELEALTGIAQGHHRCRSKR